MEKIMITGMAGGLANVIAAQICEKYEIIGVDFRDFRGQWPYEGAFLKVDYTKRAFADLFRQHTFTKVLHLGRIGNTQESFYKRYNFNVLGTSSILNLCAKYHVATTIIFSTFHIYGAHRHNPTNLEEDHPLRAGQIFPEIIDAVELDNLATSYLWKNRPQRTVVLRPCNVIGPRINNTISRFLRSKYMPYLMGFDPMIQFVFEDDIARAIILAMENEKVFGIYNVAGAGALPLTKAIEIVGGKGIPVPHYLAYPLVKHLMRLGIGFPMHLMDYFRYPVVLSDEKFRKATGYTPTMGLVDSLKKNKRSLITLTPGTNVSHR